MKRKRILVIGAVCAFVSVVMLIACLSGPKEPVHQGKKLSEWIRLETHVVRPGTIYTGYAGAHNDGEILHAVKAMGPAGMRALVNWVAYEPSPFEKLMSKATLRLPGGMQGWKLCAWLKGDAREATAESAVYTLKLLGTDVLPYVSDLSRIEKNRDRKTASRRAFIVLAELGIQLKIRDLAEEKAPKGAPWLQKSPREDVPSDADLLGDGGVFKHHGIRKRPQVEMDQVWYTNATHNP